MIIAKGKFGNILDLTVEVNNGHVLFNGKENDLMLETLKLHNLPMGGTYWVDEDAELYFYNILKNSDFFTELETIETSDDIGEIPYEENIIF